VLASILVSNEKIRELTVRLWNGADGGAGFHRNRAPVNVARGEEEVVHSAIVQAAALQ
jgi:hypothetical protein